MTDKELLDQYKLRLKQDIVSWIAAGVMEEKALKAVNAWIKLCDVCPLVQRFAIDVEKKHVEKENAQ